LKTFAVIGHPVEHSWSPELHRAVFRQISMKADYRKIEVLPEQLADFVHDNSLEGYNVTIPHKETIIPHLDTLDYHAELLQAVNCVVRENGKQVGYNTDWIGFKQALEGGGLNLAGYHVIILGAGGAAKAVAYSLAQLPLYSIRIASRSRHKADRLVLWLNEALSTSAHTLGWNQVPTILKELSPLALINTTPLGMWPRVEERPLNPRFMKEGTVLIDVIYNPPETHWLKEGKERGCKVLGGLEMFIAQGLASDRLWFGPERLEKIDLNQMRKVLISLQ